MKISIPFPTYAGRVSSGDFILGETWLKYCFGRIYRGCAPSHAQHRKLKHHLCFTFATSQLITTAVKIVNIWNMIKTRAIPVYLLFLTYCIILNQYLL